MVHSPPPLPPGQQSRPNLPRFGMMTYADRFPAKLSQPELSVGGQVTRAGVLSAELGDVERVEQTADFHCVTSWSVQQLRWSGFSFAQVYRQLIKPRFGPFPDADFVVIKGQDGYRTSLPLTDLMGPNVLLADRLNDEPLTVANGAPLRLVAPAHYGYKSVKYLSGMDFWVDPFEIRPWYLRWMTHPRGRVDREERGRGLPGWALRYLFRPSIGPVSRLFKRRLHDHNRAVAKDQST